jgi:hypothetical protein
MTRIFLLAPVALAALVAPPVLANKGHSGTDATEAAASSAQPASDAKAERKTCRTFENTVSRLKAERVCLTKDGWKKFEEEQGQ